MTVHFWKMAAAVLILFIAVFAGCSEESKKQDAALTIRFAIQPDPTNKAWAAADLFRKDLEKRSGGKIRVDFYDSGILGAERQILESCYFGIIDMVQVTSSVVSTADPLYNTLDMPYLFLDEKHHLDVMNGPIGKEFLDDLNRYGMQGLAFYSCGFRHMFNCKGPVNSPADMKGMKIRVMESPVMLSSINAMGASATPLSASELYSAIKTGVVDGAENNAQVFVSQHFDDVCKYFSETGHFANQHVLIANKKWFDSLTPENRKLISYCALEVIPAYDSIWEGAVKKATDEMLSRGVKVNCIENPETFIKCVQPVYENYKKTVPPEMVKRIMEAYRK